jgi:hypothetical protein
VLEGCLSGTGGYPYARRMRSGGFDTGATALRLPAIGRPFQVARVSPMEQPGPSRLQQRCVETFLVTWRLFGR